MVTHNERGIALVIALFLMTALSVLGASLMFLSQTETYASMNYRTMSQTRYAAEAGVNQAASFLLDNGPGGQYQVPTVAPGVDPIAAYDINKSPVQINGQPVVLSANAAVASNYPVQAVKDAFFAAGHGTLTAGAATLTYKTYATLISMMSFADRFGQQQVIQTWEITSDGGLASSAKVTVRVAAQVETPRVSANAMAAFATDNGCDALKLYGNMSTNSYDSAMGPPGAVNCAAGAPPPNAANSSSCSGGDVGTNGNIHVWGSADVNGHLYTPRPGVGACTAGAVTGLTEGGSINVAGGLVSLPKALQFPVPPFSVTPPTNNITIDNGFLGNTLATAANACATLGSIGNPPVPLTLGVNCDCLTSAGGSAAMGVAGNYTTIVVNGNGTNVTLPNISVSKNYTLDIKGASPNETVNINSLVGKGNVNFDYANDNQMITLMVAGKNADGSEMPVAFDLSDVDSQWKQNKPPGDATWDASALQIIYGGSQAINMKGGNSQSAVTLYAPNAAFSLQGTQDLFGSVLAKTVTDGGTGAIHYDRRLQREFWIVGQPMMGTFSWLRAQ